MSMNARFVAVDREQLATIEARPDTVRTVFALEAALPAEVPSLAQERLRRQAPQLVADMIKRMPPPVREQMRRRLGLNDNYLPPAGYRNRVLQQLAEREAARRRTPPPPGSPGHAVSIDKAWHGLHYLLCGRSEPSAGPLGQAVFGGREIGEDLGYGPARCFSPEEAADIAKALASPGLEATLRGRFDIAEMTRLGIYPGTWDREDRAWLIDAFRTLRKFYATAAKSNHAVVTVLE